MNVRPVSHASFAAALGSARSIALSAYTLAANGATARALERAAERGARVHVVLEGAPAGGPAADVARANRDVAADLRRHGVAVRLAAARDERVHLKAAVIDGAAYFDDRNWPAGSDTIVRVAGRAAGAAVCAALSGRPQSTRGLALEKAAAVRLEATAVCEGCGDRIDLETEAFGASAVSQALRARAAAGAHVRLLVSARAFAGATPAERSELRRVASAGVDIRLGGSGEKACVAGDRGWLGSANADIAPVPMLDWGVALHRGPLLQHLSRAFERDWRAARPFAP